MDYCHMSPFIPNCAQPEKPKGEKLVKEIEELGFNLPIGVYTRLLDGNYKGFSINPEKDVLEFESYEYEKLTLYKENFTAENTLIKC